APPLLCGEFRLGWGGCWSAGEAQVAEVMLSSPGFSFGRTWQGGRRVVGRRWPRPALRGGAVECSELAAGFGGKFGSRLAEGRRCGFGGSHALPMPVWWLLS
ncbi:Os07g0654300, partial [Oryza sativa Japonica Group]